MIKVSQDKLDKSSGAITTEGVSEKRKERIYDAAEAIAAVVNVASSLLPSSDGKGDLRSARDQVEDFGADPSDDSPYLDSVKHIYSDALRPPRAAQDVDPVSGGVKKSNQRFKNASKNVVASKKDQDLQVKASWGGKLAHLVTQLQTNPDAAQAVSSVSPILGLDFFFLLSIFYFILILIFIVFIIII